MLDASLFLAGQNSDIAKAARLSLAPNDALSLILYPEAAHRRQLMLLPLFAQEMIGIGEQFRHAVRSKCIVVAADGSAAIH